ncbi:MAG: sigma-70 family RNA polymerase sigma factor [Candidatus Eremiobacteraeota bacterium]|nr:sigma-70 family RNA polymerase sigma factor [Candidatus Eremiobacteraeota bacterium]
MLLHVERPPLEHVNDAFDRLFLREYPRCVAIARRLLFDPHLAEDVAQDAFLEFTRRHDADAPFASVWLHRAALHSAMNVLRQNRRRMQRERKNAALEAPLLAAAATFDPLHTALRSEEQRLVRSALRRMSGRHRAVLALRYAGLSYAETAIALGIKTNHVGTLLARAEAALTKEISRVPSR